MCQQLLVDFFLDGAYAPTMTMKKTKVAESRGALQRALQEIGSYERAARLLADRGVDVSGSYLSMLVRGSRDPSVAMARRISRALGIDLSDVVGE